MLFKRSVQYSSPPTSLWVSQEPLASRNDTDPCLLLPHILKESEASGTGPGQGPAGFQISVPLPQFCKHRTEKCCQPSQPPNKTLEKGGHCLSQSRPSPTSMAHTTSRCLSAHCPVPRESLNVQNQSEPRTRGFPDSELGNKNWRQLPAEENQD